MSTLLHAIEKHCAKVNKNDVSFYYIEENGKIHSSTYFELVMEAKKLAYYLKNHYETQSRILLIYPQGLEFISSFLACLYAGMVAVPAYPLRHSRHADRLHRILDSCKPQLILGNHQTLTTLYDIASFSSIKKLTAASILQEGNTAHFKLDPTIQESHIVFLQYTSGSTGTPKGVMINHANLIHNLSTLNKAWNMDETKTAVSWLPFQHDLGLVGGVLSALYNKNRLILLSPVSVVKNPFCWLKTLMDYQAYFTAGPNFAYQLCVDKITSEEAATLNLSSVGYALAAAEPNRYETMTQFCDKFAASGFKKEAYSVGYGLAENTVYVTTNEAGQASHSLLISQKHLTEGKITPPLNEKDHYWLLSAGKLDPEHEIAIVDPAKHALFSSHTVGEIWVHSRSNAIGYWNIPQDTGAIFHGYFNGRTKPFLRTGDLGFIVGDQLYVTGREKDLIIIDGRNIYPQDLEALIDTCHEWINPGATAAFSIDTGKKEAIVICAEIKRTAMRKDLSTIFPRIRQVIAEKYDVPVHDIQLLKPNGSFKTTSGKIQRKAMKAAYLNHQLACLNSNVPMSKVIKQSTAAHVEADLGQIIKEVLGLETLERQQRFSEIGGTSLHAVIVSQKIQAYVGPSILISSTIAFDYPTLAELVEFIGTLQKNKSNHLANSIGSTLSSLPPDKLSDAIAIVGVACRLPGRVNHFEALWDLLMQGTDAIQVLPEWRWKNSVYEEAIREYISQAGVIEGIDEFDASFFNISPKEAKQMDPQQRLLLQVAWEALENAAIPPSTLHKKKVGIYIGSSSHDYKDLIAKQRNHENVDPYFVLGNASSVMAGRLAYYLGTQGPAETIDTACSSSLVALDQACQALRVGGLSMAMVGSVNVILSPDNSVGLARAKMLSPTHRCRTFSSKADGYVRSEGCVVIVLKYLDEALKNGDRIYGVIKSTMVNQDGASSGLTVPNRQAQEQLLRDALAKAQLMPNEIDYIETHGSATVLGDPIELGAINAVFSGHHRVRPLYVGSVKSNIGHLEAAAGMAGLLKTLLALTHQTVPANLHLDEINPQLDLHTTPIEVVRTPLRWHAFGQPRRAGVSAFGFSGTNAHVILEEAPKTTSQESNHAAPREHLFVLSAKTASSLQLLMDRYIYYLETTNDALENICYTAALGRDHFTYRIAFIIATKEALLGELRAHKDKSSLFVEVLLSHENAMISTELSQLHQAYLSGQPIDWQFYYASCYVQARQKISLPTYCFDVERHWYEETDRHGPIVNARDASLEKMEAMHSSDLSIFTLQYVQQVFSECLTIPIKKLSPDKTYDCFGIDSILSVSIINRFNQDLPTLPVTLLFEKKCLRELSRFLVDQYPAELKKIQQDKATAYRPHRENPIACDASQRQPRHGKSVKNGHIIPSVTDQRDIAIIGLSGKYPLSDDLLSFWDNLKQGHDCITTVPAERWDPKAYPVETFSPTFQGYNQGGFISDVKMFDPLFFNIPPQQAATLMTPEERLFLQTAWTVIEDAGYTRQTLEERCQNKVGVFVGVSYNYYPLYHAEAWAHGHRLPIMAQLFSTANQVSYFFNFKGPSLAIDTACSSSLSAIHLACESIQRGDCLMALAGGVNLSLHPAKYYLLGSNGFLSDIGRCTSFGANGTGYVPAEGVGALLLKLADQALEDGDPIYAVIKASSLNHGGKTSGYSVPNPTAQAELIKEAIDRSGIDPRTITYVEAHGTGTALGDPIEISGLQTAFEHYTKDKQFCAIGSVKSNIGHAEAAAGISQVSKVVLQMRYRTLVPSLHCETLNPHIDFSRTPFYVQRELSEWYPPQGIPRRSGISSFGVGGVNVHVILEEFNSLSAQGLDRPLPFSCIFVLSAMDDKVLHHYAEKFHSFLVKTDKYPMALTDLCYTLQIGREAMPMRLAFVVKSFDEIIQKLHHYLIYPDKTRKQGFLGRVSEETSSAPVLSVTSDIDHEVIAKAWVSGQRIDWYSLYTDSIRPQRLPLLPTYPFAKRPCWLSTPVLEKTHASPPVNTPATITQMKNIPTEKNTWLYQERWVPWEKEERPVTSHAAHRYLIFADDLDEVAFDRKNSLFCMRGQRFECIDALTYRINPNDPADYHRLLSNIHENAFFKPTAFIYFWPVHHVLPSFHYQEDLCELSKKEEMSEHLLFLFQALTRFTLEKQPVIFIVTRGAQSVLSPEPVQLWQSHLWTLSSVFATEHREFQLKLIDLDPKAVVHDQMPWLIQRIQTHSNEMRFAYRQQRSFVLRLFPQSEEQSNAPYPPYPFVAHTAALISGGLGALGLQLAHCLADQGTRYLLLIGHTPLPDRNTWNNVLDKKQQEKIKGLIALEQKGIAVEYITADIADKQTVDNAVSFCEKKWSVLIDGVFHLAGITTDSVPIEQMTSALLKKVLSPKIQGTLALHDIFKTRMLKSFVLFSSLSAVPYFGLQGLTAYATGNAFLRSVAFYRQSLNQPALCIHWTDWANIGMGARYQHDAFLKTMGLTALPVSYGMEMLFYLLHHAYLDVIVQKINWKTFMSINSQWREEPYFAPCITDIGTSLKETPRILSHDPSSILTIIVNVFMEFMQLLPDELDMKRTFQAYGVDSVSGIYFIQKLNETFSNILAPMDLYRYVTLEQLADYITTQYQGKKASHQDLSIENEEEKTLKEIARLSDEEVERLLALELQELENN